MVKEMLAADPQPRAIPANLSGLRTPSTDSLLSQCQHFPECQTEPISVRFPPLEVTFIQFRREGVPKQATNRFKPMTATQGHPTPTQPSIFCICFTQQPFNVDAPVYDVMMKYKADI